MSNTARQFPVDPDSHPFAKTIDSWTTLSLEARVVLKAVLAVDSDTGQRGLKVAMDSGDWDAAADILEVHGQSEAARAFRSDAFPGRHR